MRVGAQRGLAHLREQLAEGRIAREVGAQHQRVDEEADQPLELGAPAAGDRRADHDVLLPAVALQQHLEGGQQRHEQRRPFAPAQLLKRLRQWRGQIKGADVPPGSWALAGAAGRWAAPAWADRRAALASRRAAFEHLALQPLALPDGVVGILDRQLGQQARARSRMRCRALESSRNNTPIDQPSETMWCTLSSSTCSSAARRSSCARSSGPASRSKG